jgi:hypothetical protein
MGDPLADAVINTRLSVGTVSCPNREVCDALHGEKAGCFFAGAGRCFRPIRANVGAKVNRTKLEDGRPR